MDIKITETIGDTIEILKNVFTLTVYDGSIGRRQILEAEESTTTTATGTITLTDLSNPIQFIDPGGSDRDVVLPAESIANHAYLIVNTADADETLTIKDDGASVIGYVGQAGIGWFVSNGTTWEAAYSGNVTANPVCEGRLTLESGVSVSASDQADKTTLYYALHNGNRISLYNGSAWVEHTFTERSLDVSAFTASKPYDIFIHDAGGTLTLTGLVWTNATTRATAITKLNGIYTKDGATGYRYLGTIYIDSGQKCQDTLLKRFVWNYYNRKNRPLQKLVATDNWTYGTATWRQWNADTDNKVEFVVGVNEDMVHFNALALFYRGGGYAYGYTGVGLDKTNGNDSTLKARGWSNSNQYNSTASIFNDFVGIGYHYMALVEYAFVANVVFAGDTGTPTLNQAGGAGWMKG